MEKECCKRCTLKSLSNCALCHLLNAKLDAVEKALAAKEAAND